MKPKRTGTKQELDPAALRHAESLLLSALHEPDRQSLNEIDPETPIDALGFSSIAMMELVGRLEQFMDRELDDAELLAVGTVGDLLHLVAANAAGQTEA